MLIAVLSLAFVAVIVVMIVRRRNLTLLMNVASLLGLAILLLWMIDMGLLPGSDGPLAKYRPQTLEDTRR